MTRPQAERLAWFVGVIGLICAAIGWLAAPELFPHAWLAAVTAWIGWPLGCMGLLLIHSLTGGRWGEAVRPQLVAGLSTLWLILPALLPLIMVVPSLYPWLRPEEAEQLPNRFYLNLPFAALRTIIYLVVWFGLAWLIQRALRQPRPEAALARIAPAGLIVMAITVTYAVIDLTMSLDPNFASSVYALVEIAEMGLLALSICVLAAALDPQLERSTLESLGELLMGLLVVWAYLDFVQFLISWQSDLPNEARWYLPRTTGGWGIVACLVIIIHFVLPFLALLSPSVRRSPRSIAIIAGLLVLGTVIRSWWLVVPASGRGLNGLDLLVMLGVLGIAAAVTLRAPPPGAEVAVRGHV